MTIHPGAESICNRLVRQSDLSKHLKLCHGIQSLFKFSAEFTCQWKDCNESLIRKIFIHHILTVHLDGNPKYVGQHTGLLLFKPKLTGSAIGNSSEVVVGRCNRVIAQGPQHGTARTPSFSLQLQGLMFHYATTTLLFLYHVKIISFGSYARQSELVCQCGLGKCPSCLVTG